MHVVEMKLGEEERKREMGDLSLVRDEVFVAVKGWRERRGEVCREREEREERVDEAVVMAMAIGVALCL